MCAHALNQFVNMKPKILGAAGEKLAAHYLQNKGYEIITTNFSIRGGEIDILAKHDGVLVFVEVKTRTGDSFGEGSESINGLKRLHMRRAIQKYIYKKMGDKDVDYRVDIIEVELDSKTKALKNINHFEDIEL